MAELSISLESGMSGMNVLRNLDNRVFGEID